MKSKYAAVNRCLRLICFNCIFCIVSTAQNYDIFIANRALTSSTTFEFDVYIRNDTASPDWAMKLFQTGYQFNPDFVNDGLLTGSYIAGSSDLESAFGKTWGFSYNSTLKILNQSSNIGSICPGALISTSIRKIGRFRVVNSKPWGCTDDGIVFKTSGFGHLSLAIAKYNSLNCSDPGVTLITSGAHPFTVWPNESRLSAFVSVRAQLSICDTSTAVLVESMGGAAPVSGTGLFIKGNGLWAFSITDARGCSVTAEAMVSIQLPLTFLEDTACDSYLLPWSDRPVFASGIYSKAFPLDRGCDSTVSIRLLIKQSALKIKYDTVMVSALPYLWNNGSYSASGSYTFRHSRPQSCDSLNILNLFVKPDRDTCRTTIITNTSNNIICSGKFLQLKTNESLPPGAEWRWFTSVSNDTVFIGAGDSIMVLASTMSTYWVKAQGISCAVSPMQRVVISVKNGPAQPDSIKGPLSGLCNAQNIVYDISDNADSCNYTWSIPANATILSGQGTTSVRISFSNVISNTNQNTIGSVCVRASNICGSSPPSCISVTAKPFISHSIQGPAVIYKKQVCSFSVLPSFGTSSYYWVVPAGWNILSGQGSTLLTVRSGTSGGTITVTPLNSCGYGPSLSRLVAILQSRQVHTDSQKEPGSIPGTVVVGKDRIQIESEDFLIGEAFVFDVAGRCIYKGRGHKNIDMSGWPGGWYLLQLQKRNRKYSSWFRIVR